MLIQKRNENEQVPRYWRWYYGRVEMGNGLWVQSMDTVENPPEIPHRHTSPHLQHPSCTLLHFLQRPATLVPPACVPVLVFFRRPAACKSTNQFPFSFPALLPATQFVSLAIPPPIFLYLHLHLHQRLVQPSFFPFPPSHPPLTFTFAFTLFAPRLLYYPVALPLAPYYLTSTFLRPTTYDLRSLFTSRRSISQVTNVSFACQSRIIDSDSEHPGSTAYSIHSAHSKETDVGSIACCCVFSVTIVNIQHSQSTSHHRPYEHRHLVSTLSSQQTRPDPDPSRSRLQPPLWPVPSSFRLSNKPSTGSKIPLRHGPNLHYPVLPFWNCNSLTTRTILATLPSCVPCTQIFFCCRCHCEKRKPTRQH